MPISQTFSERCYLYRCDIVEDEGTFSCAITFTKEADRSPLVTKKLKMSGSFASADIAMGAAERYGRSLIHKHGDVAYYLSNKEAPEI